MSKIVRFLEYRRGVPFVHFTRSEMNSLLSLYSRHVMRGEWRDYAIDQSDGMARFAVFRSSFERPLFVISKQVKGQAKGSGASQNTVFQFTVSSGREKVAQGTSLLDVLPVFDQPLRLLRGSS
ncbi:DUF2794 domain-containing protein [Roseospira marina]|uniref:DUF2794 domain-containing protein n=1 Tax=Roseospira marina TaxID=140057 RepID=A0A5M6IIC3_9PROT|nr:DUF2794 domain-containing protein [Roseospira marina]KAA5607318.1 DUF2794 domain-containing protein [Roseospira marina]MBB4312522.1 hypothetical protein [Roseospira marina]MBB5085462.1 hypothetical protein [Roseospira marina]